LQIPTSNRQERNQEGKAFQGNQEFQREIANP